MKSQPVYLQSLHVSPPWAKRETYLFILQNFLLIKKIFLVCGMDWEIAIDIETLLWLKQVTDENWQHRDLCSALCDGLNGKEIQERGDTCVC